jgi:opacity protein-like surface antigen
MSATLRRRIAGGLVGAAALLAPTGAFAQCVDTTGIAGIEAFAVGGSVNALISVINTLNTVALNQTTGFISAPGGAVPGQQHAGRWTRALGGTVDVKNLAVGTAPGVVGSVTCATQTRQDFDGYQVGFDIGQLNIGGANIFFGVTAGKFAARTKDRTPGQGNFKASTDVPFAGVYGAFTYGKFYMDGQLRWDFYEHRVSDPTQNIFGQRFEGRGRSISGSAGYQFSYGSGFFIEPSVGGVWSVVRSDPLNVTAGVFPGTVQIGEIESIQGRASLRLGTNFVSGRLALQPFVTASILREFAGDVTTTIATPIPLTGTLITDRVGTYAQFGAGIAGAVIDTGWVGYARVDYRTGSKIESVSGNVGLRYHFTPEKVAMGLKDAPVLAEGPHNWTGVYIGGHGASVWGEQDGTFLINPTVNPFNPGFAGWLAGGQVGYNYQMNGWVVGIEADSGRASASGGVSCPNLFLFTCEAKLNSLSSLTGRLGIVWQRALIYVKAGVATGQVRSQTTFNANVAPQPTQASATNGETKRLVGWTVGGGLEFALTERWSAKAEYMHFDLGSAVFDVFPNAAGAALGCCFADLDTQGDLVRIGVNVKLF